MFMFYFHKKIYMVKDMQTLVIWVFKSWMNLSSFRFFLLTPKFQHSYGMNFQEHEEMLRKALAEVGESSDDGESG